MTSHTDPATEAASRTADWQKAATYPEYLDAAEEFVELWTRNYERARLPEDLVARAEAVPGEWKLLVLTEDWCIDAVTTIPTLAAFAEAASNLDLRVLARDENLDLMDEHLTNGRSRSIPVVIVLDGQGNERGWWGPRPADLQAWYMGDEAQALDNDDRYRELRKWYSRDRGQTTIAEVLALVEKAGGGGIVG